MIELGRRSMPREYATDSPHFSDVTAIASNRDAADHIQYLIMDGWYPKVRIGKRRERVPSSSRWACAAMANA
jgi:hypothetical protein